MKIRIKRSCYLQFMASGLLLILLVDPVSIALASEADRTVSSQNTVTASAVVVPAQVAQLGLLVSGIAREVPVKEGDFVRAGQPLLVIDAPDLEYAVIEAQAVLRSAQSYAELQKYRRVKNRRNGKIFYDVIPVEVRQLADARVQQAQVRLELAQIDLAEGTLVAPFDGIVSTLSVTPGEFASSDQTIVTLTTLNELQLETTDLSERDIPNVNVGAPVNIFVEALHENFHGTVVYISPKADIVGGDVVFKVTIAFDQQPENLLWGMTAEVMIEE